MTQPLRPREGSCEFWVESPLQLLSAVETHAAGLTGRETLIRMRPGVKGLVQTRAALRPALPHGIRIEAAAGPVTPLSRSQYQRWGVGDLHSGQVQRALMGPSSGRETLLVDDGLATLAVLTQLTSPRPVPLVRQHEDGGPLRRMLGLRAWHLLRRRAERGGVLVVTAMPLPASLERDLDGIGVGLAGHRFEWLRSQPVHERVDSPTVVIGSALAADGLIREDAYLDWVESLTDEGPLSYFPHRRERPAALSRLAAHPGITVHPNTIPVEMRLRGLGPGQQVLSLPSTAVASLRVLLAGRGVRVHSEPVPDHWWLPATPAPLREHLHSSVRQGVG